VPLLALAVVTARLLTAAQALLAQLQQLAHLAPAVARVVAVAADARAHAEPPPARLSPVPEAQPAGPPRLELRGVTVRYPDAPTPALRSVDLVVPAGEVTVLTGPSGSGKSTLVDVALGLLRPDRGLLLVDGHPIADLPAWRGRVGYVPQRVSLAPGTVWDNLVWSARPGSPPTEQEVWQALAEAEVDAVVRRLPGGLHAELGDLTRLSGGEQQRLGIARALVRRPAFLVLDEATNALDGATERAVLDRVAHPGRTVLLVTHRPELVAGARRVVQLAAGAVVEV
jgi:ATP-binding cassette subfamily C protein